MAEREHNMQFCLLKFKRKFRRMVAEVRTVVTSRGRLLIGSGVGGLGRHVRGRLQDALEMFFISVQLVTTWGHVHIKIHHSCTFEMSVLYRVHCNSVQKGGNTPIGDLGEFAERAGGRESKSSETRQSTLHPSHANVLSS